MLGGTLQAVIGASFHGGELEHPQPFGHAFVRWGFGLVRDFELPVEVGQIGSDLLFDLLLSEAAEGGAYPGPWGGVIRKFTMACGGIGLEGRSFFV